MSAKLIVIQSILGFTDKSPYGAVVLLDEHVEEKSAENYKDLWGE